MGTLPPVHGEPKPHHRFGESIKVFTKCTSVASVSTSSSVSTSKLQTDENTFAVPFSDTTNIYDSVFDDDFPIALRKGKHTFTSYPISCFLILFTLVSLLSCLYFLCGLIFCS